MEALLHTRSDRSGQVPVMSSSGDGGKVCMCVCMCVTHPHTHTHTRASYSLSHPCWLSNGSLYNKQCHWSVC